MSRARLIVVSICFVLTGAFALAYEVVWARYLQLFIGHTTQAHTIVLATFMGGQAVGYLLIGRFADRVARPIAVYGLIEVLIGTYAILFPNLYSIAGPAFLSVARDLEPGSGALVAAKLASGVAMLFLPAVLMGGTLPLLARSLALAGGGTGRTIARLYALNCAGAVVGTLATAYHLLPGYGQAGSMIGVGLLNAFIGCVAYLAAGDARVDGAAATSSPEPAPVAIQDEETAPALALAIATAGAAATGFAAMVYEVAWFRLLAMGLGASTYAFAIMLAAFIGGMAIGARIAGSDRMLRQPPLRLFGWLQIAAACAVVLALPLYDLLPNVFRSASVIFAKAPYAFPYFQAVQLFLCAAIMIVPTTLGGMSLPVVTRALERAGRGVGRTVGRGFAANTAGTLLGAILGGLVLLPILGIRHAFTVGILVNVAAGLVALSVTSRRRTVPILLALLVAAAAFAPRISRGAFTFQTFRSQVSKDFADFGVFRQASDARSKEIIYDRDGATATVMVVKQGRKLLLYTNGKPDASTGGDVGIQLLLGHVPMLLKPDAKDVCIVGHGSGMTAGAVLKHPVASLDVIEISPEVIEASRLFDEASGAPLDDPRTRMIEEDARIALQLGRRTYDVIISEPSNPWVAGVSSLFTEEHFRTLSSRLRPGGVAVQWLQLYEFSDNLVDFVLRTYQRVFPHVRLFADRLRGDILLVGSREPFTPDLAALAARFATPAVAEDLRRDHINSLTTFLSLELFGPAETPLLIPRGAIHRDDVPTLEHEAPRSLFIGDRALRLITLAEDPNRAAPPGDRLLERHLAGRALTPTELEDAVRYYAAEATGSWRGLPGLYAAAAETLPPPVRWELVRMAARDAMLRGRPGTAARLSAPITRSDAATAQDLFNLGESLLLRSDEELSRLARPSYSDVLAVASDLATRFPADRHLAHHLEGMAHLRRGDTDAAARAFLEVLNDPLADGPIKATADEKLRGLRAVAPGG